MNQIATMLDRLIEADEAGHIDLGAMGLEEADYLLLQETLGEGEITAQVDSFGTVNVMETGYTGVWWVIHMDEEGQVLSHFLEVSYCPEILIAESEGVVDARDALKARLFELGMEQKNG